MEYIALSPRGLRPRASVQYIPYIPCARVITITYRLITRFVWNIQCMMPEGFARGLNALYIHTNRVIGQ